MASYVELNSILTDNVAGAQVLREKVRMACLIAVQIIVSNNDTAAPWDQTAGKHDQRLKWVDSFLANSDSIARQVFGIVIAANNTATQTQILQATDSAIQTNVNESIDSLATNLV